MVMIPEPDWAEEAAFVLQDDDRFHRIISSGDIAFASEPGTVAVITFFVIRRSSGLFDIFVIHKTFLKSGEVRRQVQSKENISSKQIDAEVAKIRDGFGLGITMKTKFQIKWNELDLSQVVEKEEQIQRIKQWGGLKVSLQA